MLEGHTETVRSVALTADGTKGLSGSKDKTLRLWDLERGACVQVLEGHTAIVWSVALTADGTKGLSGSKDKMLRIWDLATAKSAIPFANQRSDQLTCAGLVLDDSIGLTEATLSILRNKGAVGEPRPVVVVEAPQAIVRSPASGGAHQRRFFKPLPPVPVLPPKKAVEVIEEDSEDDAEKPESLSTEYHQ